MNTPEEWFDLVIRNRVSLKKLVLKFYPGQSNTFERAWGYPITAPGAELACQIAREQIIREPERPMPEQFDQMVDNRDRRLSSLLSSTWFGMPESYNVRFEPGFNTLCTLCEESYLLYEDDIPEDIPLES